MDSQLDSQTEPARAVWGSWVTRGDIWVYERSPAVLSETDDLEGQSWAYTPPVIVTVWDNTAAQGRFRRNFWGGGGACVSEWTGIPRHYILFRMPIKPATVKWLLCVTPSENVVNGFLLNKRPKRKRNNKNMLWFSSCATWFMDNLNGNGSRKVHDCHVFGLLRRWHKTELPFLDFFLQPRSVTAGHRLNQTILGEKRFLKYENKACGPERVRCSPLQTSSSCSCNQFTDSWASGERAIDEGERRGGRWKKIWAG